MGAFLSFFLLLLNQFQRKLVRLFEIHVGQKKNLPKNTTSNSKAHAHRHDTKTPQIARHSLIKRIVQLFVTFLSELGVISHRLY